VSLDGGAVSEMFEEHRLEERDAAEEEEVDEFLFPIDFCKCKINM